MAFDHLKKLIASVCLIFLNVYFMIRFVIIIAFGIEKWIHNNIFFSFQNIVIVIQFCWDDTV